MSVARRIRVWLARNSVYGFSRPNTPRASLLNASIFVLLLAGVLACLG